MKILIVTPHFYPETFKVNAMAFELQRRGHEVSVMTAIPDYPEGKFHKGYGVFKRRREIINGVKVHRSLVIPRGKGSVIRLALNYISYTFFATIKGFWFALTKKYDVVIVHETSPIMVGIPAVIVKKMQRIKMHFWVLDLWPESLSAAGGIKNKHILAGFNRLTKWIYNNSDTILVSSKGFKQSISGKGPFADKTHYFPNWIDELGEAQIEDPVPDLPNGFNVVFTGNIGDAQDFPNILKAAEILKDTKKIHFIIVGDGRKRQWAEEYVRANGLSNVVFLGRYPVATMPQFYEQASALLLALKDTPIFALTAPAKLQAYMYAGKPIVAMLNGDGTNLVNEANCGWSVPAESPQALADLIMNLSETNRSILNEKGENGKRYAKMHFDFTKCIDNLETFIKIGDKD